MLPVKILHRSLLLTGALSALLCGTAYAAAIGAVTGNNVNIRRDPSTAGDVYRQLSVGHTVTITGKTDDWYEVLCADGSTAYVAEDFVSITKVDAKVSDSGVNLRQSPDTGSATLAQLSAGTALDVNAQTGDWYKVYCASGSGYIHKDYVTGNLVEEVRDEGESLVTPDDTITNDIQYIQVNAATGLNVRANPNTQASVVELLSNNAGAEVISNLGDWLQIRTQNGNVGYVSAEFVTITDALATLADANASLAEQIISFAKQYIGTSYRWGGTDLNNGVDCSGFVYSVLKNFGIGLNRSSASMAASNGTPVDKANLQMGDLVFFDTDGANDGNVSHVGIYIGNGDYIHSSSGKAWGVTISNLNEAYSARTYVCARRVL